MNTRRFASFVNTRRSRHALVAIGLGALALSATLAVAAPVPLPRGTVSVELVGAQPPAHC